MKAFGNNEGWDKKLNRQSLLRHLMRFIICAGKDDGSSARTNDKFRKV